MKIELSYTQSKIGDPGTLIKIGNKVKELWDGHDLEPLLKQYKKIRISTKYVKGWAKWRREIDLCSECDNKECELDNSVTIKSTRGTRYNFCEDGLKEAGIKRPTEKFVYVKLG